MAEICATTPWWLPRVRRLSFSTGTSWHPHAVTDAEVFQLRHQLPFGTFADVKFLDLASSLDGFGHGTYPENNVVHSSLFFICPWAGGTRFSRVSRKSLFLG